MSARAAFSFRFADLIPNDDRALLARFAEERDESAFASLMRRHAGMVLGVCRRAVRDSHLAEDATQATFLVLARNPTAARQASSVAGWLFGIARRVGSAARRHEQRRQKRESIANPERDRRESVTDELLRTLDEELAALPEHQRSALIACYLREQTQDEAARELGWSLSTLRRRLERGKALLRSRLARRGVALSSSLLLAALAPKATAAVSFPQSPSLMVKSLAAEAMKSTSASKAALVTIAALFTTGLVAAFSSVPPPVSSVAPPAEVVPVSLPAPVPAAEWVKLKGRVVFPKKQDIPPRIEVKTKFTIKDEDHCLSQGKLYFEDLLIDPKNHGIKNCVVFLRPDAENRTEPFPKDRIHPMLEKPKAKTHTATIECCQFEPRVLAVRGGDMVRFKNESKVAHNAHYQTPPGREMDAFNVLLPMDKDHTSNALTASRSPSLFRCNIHPWMQGYVWTFDHPYFAVTAADGSFTIPDAPVGKWRVVVWHEKVGYRNWQVKPLGELSTLKDDGKAQHDLGNIEFNSDAWVEKKDE